MPRVNHVILTRFNLPSRGVEGVIRAREGWLRSRVELFERFCAPSVAAQSEPVSWIIYFDPESPDWLVDRLAPWVSRGLFRPVMRASVSRQELLGDIAETVPQRGDLLITTSLDNDDALAADHLTRVAAVDDPRPRTAIYVTRGLVRSGVELHLHRDPRNAFCSVREAWDDPLTAWAEYHNELSRVMPVRELDGPPGWMQVVHGNNVSNRVRGRLVSPEPYQAVFPGLLDDVVVPGTAELARDRVVGRPARAVRDSARAAARTTGLKLLGKERYSQLKLGFSRVRRAA